VIVDARQVGMHKIGEDEGFMLKGAVTSAISCGLRPS
jgi:hypothetical protein